MEGKEQTLFLESIQIKIFLISEWNSASTISSKLRSDSLIGNPFSSTDSEKVFIKSIFLFKLEI